MDLTAYLGSLDLSKLSKQEKLTAYDVIQELKRREKKKTGAYIPNSGQLTVHSGDKLERYVFSGNGAGKTALLVNEVLWAARGFNPILKTFSHVPCKIIYVIDDPDKIALKILPEMRKWQELKDDQLEKDGKPYIARITFPNGSFIKFITHGMEAMKAESIELDFLACDEPPPYFLYSALTRGMREKGFKKKTLIVGTPLAAPWLRKDVYEPWSRGKLPYVECYKFDSDVNKDNLDWDRQLHYFDRLSDKERAIRRHGNFFDLEGLALSHLFKRDSHVVKQERWPSSWPVVIAVDPHPSKEHVALMVGITPANGYRALKELSSSSPARQFARELRDFYKGYRVIDLLSDSLGSSDSTGGEGRLSFIQVLRDEGIRIRATSYDEKKDEAWIQMIQDVLLVPDEANNFGERAPRLQIVDNCTGLISDIETVEWQKFKNIDEYKPKLAIGSKDLLACLKYALASQPRHSKGREKIIRSKNPASWNNK